MGTDGLRERKKAATWHLLETVALRLAVERGLAAMTVESISEAANVSPRTFFNYFASKEDAVLGRSPHIKEWYRAQVADRPADEPVVQALRAALVMSAGRSLGSRDHARTRMRLAAENPSLATRLLTRYAEIETGLAEGIAARLDAAGDDPRCVTLAAVGAGVMRAASRRWVAGDDGRPGQSLAETVDELFGVAVRLVGSADDIPVRAEANWLPVGASADDGTTNGTTNSTGNDTKEGLR